jgi:hypothetical protein
MKRFQKIFTVLAILLSMYTEGWTQTLDSYEYQSEFVWGINKNTAGGLIGGFVFKKSRKLSERTLETFGLEIMNIKHPQESRRNSYSGNFYTYGKNNYLYSFRFQYGRDFILFKKAPQQGVEIKAVLAVGPSIGIVAPYYVEWAPDGGNGFYTIREQWNPSIPAESILGPGRLFEGLGESSFAFGGNLKAAVNFELGTFKSQVTGFEGGILLDAYTKEIEMVPTAKNYSVYPTLFITFFYGTRK